MNEQIRLCFIALLSLGFAASYSIAAAAQEIIEETYTVEEVDPPAAVSEDDDTAVIEDDDEPEVILADRDGMSRCAATFRSFDPETGTYMTYDGETLRCPYLE
mgnify:CR=1 FL=1